MNYQICDDDYDYDDYDYWEEEDKLEDLAYEHLCINCGCIGIDQCGCCGGWLCGMCSECGCGFCHDCPTEEWIAEQEALNGAATNDNSAE